MNRTYIHALGIVNALGDDVNSVRTGLLNGSMSGIRIRNDLISGRTVHVGEVICELPELESEFAAYASRNNRMLTAAVLQIHAQIQAVTARYGKHRIGIVLGTSTSGIAEGERGLEQYLRTGKFPADFDYQQQQEISSPSQYLRHFLGVGGPAWTVSTACTSSAKAFSSARRLLNSGACDAVVVGGVDTLCRLTLNGFGVLESLSDGRCNPFSAHRDGINIGEGAAIFLVSRDPGPVCLLGIGETSDAFHISGPDPEGVGAELAMRKALADAGIAAGDVDYLNLHGTATVDNDQMESHAVERVFGASVPCSSTKPMVGHMLGAAGATELAFCWMLLSSSRPTKLPPHIWDQARDPGLSQLNLYPGDGSERECRLTASNSFAFGGNNISIILGRES
ncbi:MAG: beta-ketoacyl-[acyl-carrier-protein] synthase family protein [Gammaproteobacteria bacterium]|nr:beta-ketoacyl-[acyl-carrier-protein] synthase family protein [Gammaproteobacteria bacterium]